MGELVFPGFSKSPEFLKMKPEAMFFGATLIAPILCHFIAQTTAARVVLSAAASALLMSLCLIIGETRASLPDFDIVFGIYFIGWNVIAVIYAIVVSLCLSAVARLIKRMRGNKHSPKDEP